MLFRWTLLTIGLFAITPLVRADRAFPTPGVDRIALADAIVVGKVTGVEPVDVELTSPGEKIKVKHRVALVEVSETVLGKKDTKKLRVAFVPVDEKIKRRYPPLQFRLVEGNHGLMFLRKHPSENVFVGTMEFDFLPFHEEGKPMPPQPFGGGSYQEELKKARSIAKLLEDPNASLKSKDIADRYMTAAHLIFRYRTPRFAGAKSEAISAEETKQLFAVLFEQDWVNTRTPILPWQAFASIGLTEKDGWKIPRQVKDHNDLRAAAQAWYRDHGKEYRIQRFVASASK